MIKQIKKLALSAMLLGSSIYLMADCPINILNPEINPRPLTYLSTGNISFEVLEDRNETIPAKDSFGDPTCLFNIEMSYVTLENNDTANITGAVLDYFDVEFVADQNRVYFTQNKDIPGDTYVPGIISVDVIQESTSAQKYNGFQLNVYDSEIEGSQFTYTVREVLPPVPILVDGTDVNETDPTTVFTNDTTPEINGTCEANNTVTIQIDGEDIDPTVDCSDDGTFSIIPIEEIPEGEYNITATQTDPDTNVTSAPSPVDYVNVDTTAPTAPIVTITEDIDNNGEISQANELNGNINVLVTVPAGTNVGDVLTITNPDGTTVNVPVTSDIISNGYPLEYAPIAAGETLTVKATLKDQAGNVSAQSEDSAIVVDDVAPETLTIDNVDGQTGTPITTADTTPEINGTCTPDDNGTVVIQIDGVDITPTTTCTADGTYSVSPDTPLTEGEHNVTASESDDAGNTKTTPAVALIVYATVPGTTITTIDGNDTIGISPTTVTTPNPYPVITGTCESGYIVTVQIDGTDIDPTVECSTNGTFVIKPTEPIAEGEHNVTSTQTNSNGETSNPSPADTLIVHLVDCNAGTIPGAGMSGYVWFDENGNGIQDESKGNGVVEVNVVLINSSGEVIEQTKTDSNGNYKLNNLVEGEDYTIKFSIPNSYNTTIKGVTNDGRDSDVNSDGSVEIINFKKGGEELDMGINCDCSMGTNPEKEGASAFSLASILVMLITISLMVRREN